MRGRLAVWGLRFFSLRALFVLYFQALCVARYARIPNYFLLCGREGEANS